MAYLDGRYDEAATIRLFRQSVRGDWNGQIRQITAALKELFMGGGHLSKVSTR